MGSQRTRPADPDPDAGSAESESHAAGDLQEHENARSHISITCPPGLRMVRAVRARNPSMGRRDASDDRAGEDRPTINSHQDDAGPNDHEHAKDTKSSSSHWSHWSPFPSTGTPPKVLQSPAGALSSEEPTTGGEFLAPNGRDLAWTQDAMTSWGRKVMTWGKKHPGKM